jgi:hypothetical protein
MDKETLDLIANHVNGELKLEGYNTEEIGLIWISLTKLVLIMDLNQAPIHNPLFVKSLHSLARALDLINSLRKK